MKKKLLFIALLIALIYGGVRTYFSLTGGFHETKIYHDLPYDVRWEIKPLKTQSQEEIKKILSQPFFYLGKGAQSYAFVSLDGNYVIKFLKYQRFLPETWPSYFAWIPFVKTLQEDRVIQRKKKLEDLFVSWKLVAESLTEQTGVLYVHINQTEKTLPDLLLFDKVGLGHKISLDRLQFLVQKKADLLCDALCKLMGLGKEEKAKAVLSKLVSMVVKEYQSGFADNDHFLMQNTGVFIDEPVHIDVGQFVANPEAKDPEVYHQELFNKMYRFRYWLKEHYPSLLIHLDQELRSLMPEKFDTLKQTRRKL